MDISEAKRLRELERENAELKKIMAEQALDMRTYNLLEAMPRLALQGTELADAYVGILRL